MSTNPVSVIREMSDDDIVWRVRNINGVLKHDSRLRSKVEELATDYMYDREVCESLGVNYARPTILEESRIKLYAYSVIMRSRQV